MPLSFTVCFAQRQLSNGLKRLLFQRKKHHRHKKMNVRTLPFVVLVVAASWPLAQAESALSNGPTTNSSTRTDHVKPSLSNLGQNGPLHALYAGVVLNQTVTKVGQDFYQFFVTAWRDKPLSERYVLSVHERPSARLGSQVWVEYANRRVFQTFLPPIRSRAQDAGLDAVEVAYQNIVNTDVVNLLFRDPDLGPDELKN